MKSTIKHITTGNIFHINTSKHFCHRWFSGAHNSINSDTERTLQTGSRYHREQQYTITCNDGTGATVVVMLDWLCCLKRYA